MIPSSKVAEEGVTFCIRTSDTVEICGWRTFLESMSLGVFCRVAPALGSHLKELVSRGCCVKPPPGTVNGRRLVDRLCLG